VICGNVAERVDPVATPPAAISCSDPAHDLELTEETLKNPLFELGRYAPSLAKKLGFPAAEGEPADQACPQDRANVALTVKEMKADGELEALR
jgi:hypothetical protein